MTEWINVDQQRPELGEVVLVCDYLSTFVSLARLSEEDNEYVFELMSIDKIENDSEVTHWMPLPNPPDVPGVH
jgi:hypothetical protein